MKKKYATQRKPEFTTRLNNHLVTREQLGMRHVCPIRILREAIPRIGLFTDTLSYSSSPSSVLTPIKHEAIRITAIIICSIIQSLPSFPVNYNLKNLFIMRFIPTIHPSSDEGQHFEPLVNYLFSLCYTSGSTKIPLCS